MKTVFRLFQLFVAISIFIFAENCFAADDAYTQDPVYRGGHFGADAPPVHQMKETIDPFTGHLRLVHTEVDVPVGGGLNLTLMRYYDSDIWSFSGTANSTMLKTLWKRSPLGMGWYMHMGLLRYSTTDAQGNRLSGSNEISDSPVVEMPDGSQHVFYADKDINTIGVYVSKENWTLKRLNSSDSRAPYEWEMTLTDGTVYKFEYWRDSDDNRFNDPNNPEYPDTSRTFVSKSLNGVGYTDPSGSVAQCTKIENPTGNSRIEIEYDRKDSSVVGEYSYMKKITDTTEHEITFVYDETLHQMKEVTFKYKSYQLSDNYAHQVSKKIADYAYESYPALPQYYNYLTTATPPVGKAWSYDYELSGGGGAMVPPNPSIKGQLTKITYPQGGTIDYKYKNVQFNVGKRQIYFRVIDERATGGRSIDSGTWTYQFDSPMTSLQTTTITIQPDNLKEVIETNSWGNVANGSTWKVGLPKSKTFKLNDVIIFSETYAWDKSSDYISENDIFSHDWAPQTFIHIVDTEVYVPLLTSKSITRDGKTYTTTYPLANYDAYGNPKVINESGDASRSWNLTYWTNTASNIVKGRPSVRTLTGGTTFPGTFSTGYKYFTDGYLQQVNRNGTLGSGVVTGGVETKFTYYTTDSNLKTEQDANLHTTTYEWYNGQVSKKINSIYTEESRNEGNGVVNFVEDGRDNRTAYEYDAKLNPTKVIPPIGQPTVISYPTDGSYSWRKETKGTWWRQINYDGFGREISSSDSKGATTATVYKASGYLNYKDSNIGDKVYYDPFGRIDKVEHKDGKYIDYAYSGDSTGTLVTITDEQNYVKTLTYNCFGDPDDKYLVKVTEPGNIVTSYKYNALGSLTEIDQGGTKRTYLYNTKNFLTSETNPETGTISYPQRKSKGNLEQKQDSLGNLYTYTWDDLDRLKTITKSGGQQVSFDYDNSDNRNKIISPTSNISVDYNEVNLPKQRTEIVSGTTYTTTYSYNPNYLYLETLTYPFGRKIQFIQDSNYRPREIRDFVTQQKFIHTINYKENDQPDDYYLGNGLYQDFSYNLRYFNTRITAGGVVDKEYVPDFRGNTTDIIDHINSSKTQSFTYDGLNRVKTFNGAWGGGTFDYYNYGNRKTKTLNGQTGTYNYGPITNRLDSISGAEASTFLYNNDGTLSSGSWGGQPFSFTYDDFRNVKQISSGATTLGGYGYDGDGLRVTKTAGGRTTIYHHDEGGNVLSENYSNGKLIADYVYFNGKLIAKIDANVDYDGDGYPDANDAFPLNAAEWLDTDNDGIGNNADTDDDNDGYLDVNDAFPLNAAEWLDTDNDGIGNNADTDDDGDGYLDVNDAFPLNAAEWLDTDSDGIGNNADTDDDGDEVDDLLDDYPTDKTRSSLPVLVSVEADGTWKNLTGVYFQNPIVIANVPTYRDAEPVTVRVRNVTKFGFSYRLQEWDYLDGTHAPENISFLIMERGHYVFANGEVWEAGTKALSGNNIDTSINFMMPFYYTSPYSCGFSICYRTNYIPPRVVLLTAQTDNDSHAIVARTKTISPSSFTAAIYEEEACMGSGHGAETIGYLAIYSYSSSVNLLTRGRLYQTVIFRNLPVSSTFSTPQFWSALKLQEEQSSDSETDHVSENVCLFSILGHGLFAGTISNFNSDTFALRRDDDTDHDGQINSIDTDDDQDGVLDSVEVANGTNPLDPNSH